MSTQRSTRRYQGDGRHDNPEVYGCLYLTEHAVSAVVEQLARFRGTPLGRPLLVRHGLPLALATIDLDAAASLIDFDQPTVLSAHALRPSLVATRRRDVTRPQALALYRSGAPGVRWWSTFEALWANVTIFDRAARRLRLADIRRLEIEDPVVEEAAEFLGLALA